MEHALIFASLIVAVAVTDQMMSMNKLLHARRRVSWDWAIPMVALLALLTVVQIWWTIAQPRAGAVTIGQFLPSLVELILLFLLCSATLPDEVPAEGLSLRAYYDEQSPYIWTLFSLALGWLLVTQQIGIAMAGNWQPARLLDNGFDLLVFALMVSLVRVRKLWWHLLVMLLLYSGPLNWLSRSLS